jgi:osmoprotectant transport system permease protein
LSLLSGIGRTARADRVAVTGAVIGLFSLAFSWFTLKPNRLVGGEAVSLWQGDSWYLVLLLLAGWLGCLYLGWRGTRRAVALGVLGNLTLTAYVLLAGYRASLLMAATGPFARVSPGAGFWLAVAGAYVVIFAARQQITARRWHLAISFSGLLAVIVMLGAGWLDQISILREYQAVGGRFGQEFLQHIFLFSSGVGIGSLLGVPLGVWASRSRHAARPVFWITNIFQTIPSLALYGLLIAPLAALSMAYPALREIGIRGIGTAPAIIALTIYSLLPMVRNTYTGLRQIDPAVLDAGRGMGMNRGQVFFKLELPLAAPLILEGMRTAAVQTVGIATIASLVGAGGLGHFVFQGLGQAAPDLVMLGALPIIGLALLVDLVMRRAVVLATPVSLRGGPA